MSAPELVRVGPDEWETFRDVRLASLADAPGAFGALHADWVDASEQRWRSRLTDVPFTIVATSDGRGVGVVSGAQSDDHVELISMWVAPDHRGTGLAGRLISSVADWASTQGHDTFLMVRDDNARAITAYEKAGFVDLGVPEDWPVDALRERRMRRSGRDRRTDPRVSGVS
ncbi:GNAT family N-acetyltransferase [Nocardioides baculatus]|uniref:GNAT family N-acetyltransferase n=1 Tax=Nocardioides baculatus TaxID=2801337 RepID=A0ABS1LAY2_9ACTN|nr:GNAT family N-acetyltransferase [Nocardioides baculatus]MBL0748846.1 GNAT family N-acetyltransferase [Nocardioides baculatus]